MLAARRGGYVEAAGVRLGSALVRAALGPAGLEALRAGRCAAMVCGPGGRCDVCGPRGGGLFGGCCHHGSEGVSRHFFSRTPVPARTITVLHVRTHARTRLVGMVLGFW